MTGPAGADVLASAIKELLAQAKQLGLTWTLRPATVTQVDPLQVVLDSDNTPVGATLLAGAAIAQDRVFCILIPPGGIYVVGRTQRMGCTLRRNAPQTLPDTAYTDVSWDSKDEDTDDLWTSGGTVTIPTDGDGLWAITFGIATADLTTGRAFIAVLPSSGNWSGGGVPLRNPYSTAEDKCAMTVIIPMTAGMTFTCGAFGDFAAATTMTASLDAYRVSG